MHTPRETEPDFEALATKLFSRLRMMSVGTVIAEELVLVDREVSYEIGEGGLGSPSVNIETLIHSHFYSARYDAYGLCVAMRSAMTKVNDWLVGHNMSRRSFSIQVDTQFTIDFGGWCCTVTTGRMRRVT